MPPTARPRPTRAACAAASIWRPLWCTGRPCCSWTSPPPGSARQPQRPLAGHRGAGGRRHSTVLLTTVPGRGGPARRPHRGHRPRRVIAEGGRAQVGLGARSSRSRWTTRGGGPGRGPLTTWFATRPTTSGSTVRLTVDDSATVVGWCGSGQRRPGALGPGLTSPARRRVPVLTGHRAEPRRAGRPRSPRCRMTATVPLPHPSPSPPRAPPRRSPSRSPGAAGATPSATPPP
jgi:hypothetical protein